MSGKVSLPVSERFRRKSRCDDCPSACCQYVAVIFQDGPHLPPYQINYIRYVLMHRLMVRFDGEDWAVYLESPCQHLVVKDGQHRCGIYEKRPSICRDHSEEHCSEKEWFLHGTVQENEVFFRTVEEFDKWTARARARTAPIGEVPEEYLDDDEKHDS